MNFYRVQKENGCGVYRTNGTRDREVASDRVRTLYSISRHPVPLEDSKLVRSMRRAGAVLVESKWLEKRLKMDFDFIEKYIFGFSSMKALESWFFNDDIKSQLKSMGYKIFVLKNVNSVLKGSTQSIILKEEFAATEKKIIELI